MKEVITAVAHVIALETGAPFTTVPGVAYDCADNALGTLAGALLKQVAGTGIDLLSLRRQGSTLVAIVNEDQADEPLCPAAFNRVVRRLSHQYLGEVWEGRFEVESGTPVPVPAH